MRNCYQEEKKYFDARYKAYSDTKVFMSEQDKRRYLEPSSRPIFAREFMFYLMGDVKGKRVLDYDCGIGEGTIHLVYKGAYVTAIDCSDKAIKHTVENAERYNLKDNIIQVV